jgi:hypothetical protein
LECLRSISQAEAHEKVLKQTKGRDDGGLWDVGGGDGYTVKKAVELLDVPSRNTSLTKNKYISTAEIL